MKRVLMVAYHFPPLAGSSGIQRTLRFVQHLPDFGWEPTVLTAHPRAYERTSDDLLRDVPAGSRVEARVCLDAARHLVARRAAIRASWRARTAGLRGGSRASPPACASFGMATPQAIWSTYPIATAHVIGDALQRRSGLPWIADFRDPMAQEGYPADPRVWRSFQHIEMSGDSPRALQHLYHARRGACLPGPLSRMRPAGSSCSKTVSTRKVSPGSAQDRSALEPLNAGAKTLLHAASCIRRNAIPRNSSLPCGAWWTAGDCRTGSSRSVSVLRAMTVFPA